MSDELYPWAPILLVDDETAWLRGMSLALARALGVNNHLQCADSREVLGLLASREVSVVILDVTMPYLTGEDLLARIRQEYPQLPVIMLTGRNQVDIAVRCTRLGAFDYFIKTDEEERLLAGVRRAIEQAQLQRENRRLQDLLLQPRELRRAAFQSFDTISPRMEAIFRYVDAIAVSSEPVLITGESGTGKELIARAIHRLSCPDGPLVAVNAAGLDDQIFADTLFGHLRGAYTGAQEVRKGMIEEAAGGVLFLDEVGELSSSSQIKLLRLLQEGEYFPLGSDQPRKLKARLVFATNLDLEQQQASGAFRKDLYYRLRSHRIAMPPLRERSEDLPLMLTRLLHDAATAMGKKVPTVPPELITLLRNYPFPGNIRELRAMVYDAVSQHSSGILSMHTFKKQLQPMDAPGVANSTATTDGSSLFAGRSLPTIKGVVAELIDEALKRSAGNQSLAARMLGISPPALCKRLKNSADTVSAVAETRKGIKHHG
ncbi:MAG: sigma-54-dependent Fis family transcriptional regulator [Desulfuromonadales bacterium]|nr:sigma-54-dependent Fis family transcriptional regulator [Desulfuromonadales bacterium]